MLRVAQSAARFKVRGGSRRDASLLSVPDPQPGPAATFARGTVTGHLVHPIQSRTVLVPATQQPGGLREALKSLLLTSHELLRALSDCTVLLIACEHKCTRLQAQTDELLTERSLRAAHLPVRMRRILHRVPPD